MKYLYHYTRTEEFASILKTKKIKFNRLTNMDDIEEGNAKDFKNMAKIFFVSSWTYEEDNIENIGMWNSYCNYTNGVRIGLPLNPFKEYIYLKNKSYIPNEYKQKYTISPFQKLLVKVEYTNNNDLLYPTVEYVGGNFNGGIGKYKKKHWRYQNEWRYVIQMIPMPLNEIINYDISMFNNDSIFNVNNLFLEIDEEKLKDMTVTLAPKIKIENKRRVYEIVKKYNPNCIITKSDCSIR